MAICKKNRVSKTWKYTWTQMNFWPEGQQYSKLPDTIIYLHTKFHVSQPNSLWGKTVPKIAQQMSSNNSRNWNNSREIDKYIFGHMAKIKGSRIFKIYMCTHTHRMNSLTKIYANHPKNKRVIVKKKIGVALLPLLPPNWVFLN